MGTHHSLRGWYMRKRKTHVDNQIREIIRSHRPSETAGVALPRIRRHKTEALAGDTVYLGRNNSIRSFILSALNKVDYEEGEVSISSPVGRSLLGRHPGDKVHLATLDGSLDYTILKII